MRILMVSDVYFPRINGVSTSIQTFKQEFEKQGHEVILIAPDYPQEYLEDDSIIRIKSRGVLFDPEDRMMHYQQVIALADTLAEEKFNLVHVHTPFVAHYAGVKLAEILQIPCVATYHTLFEEYLFHYIPFLPKQMLRAFARRFSKTQCNQVESIVAPSSVIVSVLERYGVEQSINIVPTGIRSENFKSGNGNKFRQRFGIGGDRVVLLNVGRVAYEKNLGLLLHTLKLAVDKLPQLCLVIAGEGPARKSCMEQARQLGLIDHVHFVGYLNRNTELLDCYHSADLFVFSSKTETQGLVLLEAMAAGTPVVSVAAMGTRDILIDCPSALIVEDNAEDFSNKLIDLLNDQLALESLKSNCEAAVHEWNSTVMASKMLMFYEQVVQNSRTEIPNFV